jgi:hypothetical protein
MLPFAYYSIVGVRSYPHNDDVEISSVWCILYLSGSLIIYRDCKLTVTSCAPPLVVVVTAPAAEHRINYKIMYEITKSMLKDYKGTSLKEYKQNKSKRAFERVYGRLKRYITLW